jgi:hypothetical protein
MLRNSSNKEKLMTLRLAGIGPGTNGDHCPAVFVDEETGDFVFQGWTVTDPVTLADVARRSPVADSESVVRLPARMRQIISDLCLPGNDYWLFDDRLVRFHYFSGDGEIMEDELVSDAATAKMCARAFEAVWERAIPHAEYRPA